MDELDSVSGYIICSHIPRPSHPSIFRLQC